MNYITACPACETQFLITKEHLKAYRGKVQCGNCNHIFNAKNRLTEVSEDFQNAEEHAEAHTSSEIESDEIVTSASDIESTPSESITTELSSSGDEKPINEKLNVVLEAVPDLSDLTSADSAPPDLDSAETTRDSYISKPITETISENDIDIESIRAPILIEDLTADPKFQLTKPKRNVWLLVAICLLLIVAILQSTYFSRSKIAANYPQFKPYLVQACEYLRCKINLPQQLDLLTIDDSDMQESQDYQDVIAFSSLVINNANYVQAYPNIELTLTDAEDKPVLRKLVKPQEYLQASTDAAKGLAAHEEERIKLMINVHNLSVAGYRVLLTY
ncbi:zinc-ribbon and DUF3426 domain-containing protein [Methylotenera versatilis]|uniref:zinc-ribbon and DUF3426 domain-containing protein n=1 Tax=Methylotenera versatilis TaxID=1055487 RepID=UPI000647022A|nr:zinc-ribbon and DUF3426 domain-containing protein [Methylotenera versatilis]